MALNVFKLFLSVVTFGKFDVIFLWVLKTCVCTRKQTDQTKNPFSLSIFIDYRLSTFCLCSFLRKSKIDTFDFEYFKMSDANLSLQQKNKFTMS